MKNYVQPGDLITFTAAAAASSGDGVLVNSLFGIASGDAAIGEYFGAHHQGRVHHAQGQHGCDGRWRCRLLGRLRRLWSRLTMTPGPTRASVWPSVSRAIPAAPSTCGWTVKHDRHGHHHFGPAAPSPCAGQGCEAGGGRSGICADLPEA